MGLKSGGASSAKTTNAELVHILDQQEVVGILICKHSGCITAFRRGTPACSPAQQRLTDTHTHPYTGPQSKKIFQGKKWGIYANLWTNVSQTHSHNEESLDKHLKVFVKKKVS